MTIVHALFTYWQSPFIRSVIFYFALNYFHAAAQVVRLGYHYNILSLNYVINKSNIPADTASRVIFLLLLQSCSNTFWKTIKTLHVTV